MPASPSQPLHDLIARIRKPQTLRELMAACLRSAYRGDPFTGDETVVPSLPDYLIEGVEAKIDTSSGVPCQIYSPRDIEGHIPVMLYMHGGGFVIGNSDDTDYVTRILCHHNKMIVVSIDYRLAPETVFPGAVADCKQVLDWVIKDSRRLKVDQNSIYFGGDSAGANLALALAQECKHARGLVLLAPWLDMAVELYDSCNRLAPEGIVFDAAFLGYARAAYVGYKDWTNPMVSPIYASLKDLPPTLILIGDADPFIDQVIKLKDLAHRQAAHNIQTVIYPGMPHCFYSFPNLFDEEQQCFKEIQSFLYELHKTLPS